MSDTGGGHEYDLLCLFPSWKHCVRWLITALLGIKHLSPHTAVLVFAAPLKSPHLIQSILSIHHYKEGGIFQLCSFWHFIPIDNRRKVTITGVVIYTMELNGNENVILEHDDAKCLNHVVMYSLAWSPPHSNKVLYLIPATICMHLCGFCLGWMNILICSSSRKRVNDARACTNREVAHL